MKSLTLQRIAAVDVFRALTMFLMLFVNDIPGLKNVPHWLMHARMDEDMMGFSDTIFRFPFWACPYPLPYKTGTKRETTPCKSWLSSGGQWH